MAAHPFFVRAFRQTTASTSYEPHAGMMIIILSILVCLLNEQSQENDMDNDVINISDMTDEELRTHLRRLSDYSSCPCVLCCAICDRPEKVATCDAYQLWLWDRMKYRGGADG